MQKGKYVYRNGRWTEVAVNARWKSKRAPDPEGEFIHIYEKDINGKPRLVDIEWYQVD